MNQPPGSRACWPIVWLWILSIIQYSYRYILQVNDPQTSHLYGSTPGYLSAIKYGVFTLFAFYAIFCFLRRPVCLTKTYLSLMQLTGVGLVLLAAVLLLRIAWFPGDMEDTLLCALELVPWIVLVFFVPLVVEQEHSALKTLTAFERLTFWIIFPFWLMTVILAAFGIRYPALSYPGLLVRYGGIIDDPNGYACLCLLLLALSAAIRRGAWRWRVAIYIVMLIGTLSLSGYATAIVMLLCWLLLWLTRASLRPGRRIAKAGIVCVVMLAIAPLVASVYDFEDTAEFIASIYSAKGRSAAAHVSDLGPNESILEDSSFFELLCGTGGFSESLYWRIFANFGLVGLTILVVLALSWTHHALWRIKRWRHSIGVWGAGFLVGSNGIAYLLTFPLSLIYWSLLGFLICEDAYPPSDNLMLPPALAQRGPAILNPAASNATICSSRDIEG